MNDSICSFQNDENTEQATSIAKSGLQRMPQCITTRKNGGQDQNVLLRFPLGHIILLLHVALSDCQATKQFWALQNALEHC